MVKNDTKGQEVFNVKVRQTHRLRGFDKDLGASKLELIRVHLDRTQEMKDALFLVSSPCWPGLFGQNGVPEDQNG